YGRSPKTPVALIQNGTLPIQRTVTGTLADIAEIAEAAGISEDDISIKATTNETMGFIGRKEGLVAYAVCLIEKN
ncbi:MAG: 2-C-methyl-D-erythritol 2,4-cyclodiphosphate synthase, partial [Daejeonella sp.]|nr:2-C-methyl-D-erythritol 2,4-cyclodiphosphate synthase [Daejeonella sp.]